MLKREAKVWQKQEETTTDISSTSAEVWKIILVTFAFGVVAFASHFAGQAVSQSRARSDEHERVDARWQFNTRARDAELVGWIRAYEDRLVDLDAALRQCRADLGEAK